MFENPRFLRVDRPAARPDLRSEGAVLLSAFVGIRWECISPAGRHGKSDGLASCQAE